MSSKQYKQATDIYTRLLKQRACHNLPRPLASDMVQKIEEVGKQVFRRSDSTFLDIDVINSDLILEVIERLRNYGHSKENIENRVFGIARFAACKNRVEEELAKKGWNITIVQIRRLSELNVEELQRALKNKIGVVKFDVVAGNPPYQKSTGTGNPIWHKFVESGYKIAKNYLCFVHPAIWRKPQNNYTKCKDIQPKLFESVKYLSIHDSAEGEEVFGAGTRFDWYVADVKNGNGGKVKVVDESGKIYTAEIEKWPWIPNYKYELIEQLIATNGQPKCEFIGDRTTYGSDSTYVSSEKSEEYNLPLLHTTPKTKNTRWKYSSKIQKDENGNSKHFETPKVIFGGNGIGEVIIDMEGQYGLTEEARGVVVENKTQAEKVAKAVRSDTFQEIQDATSWSNYRMDRDLMNEFRRDWYETVLEIEKQRNDD